jgi:hypothetical protein
MTTIQSTVMATVDSKHRFSLPFFVTWILGEGAAWVAMSAFGTAATSWILAVSLLVGIVFLMVWGTIRVLRGGNL